MSSTPSEWRHIVSSRCLNVLQILLVGINVAYAQTPEDELQKCVAAEIEKLQPKSTYQTQQFSCSVGNKRPLSSPPSSGPNPIVFQIPDHIFLTAEGHETYKISEGGFLPLYISPRRDNVTSAIWCKAEDKDFGKSGKYGFYIDGEKQRIATRLELKRVLQHCTNKNMPSYTKQSQVQKAKP